MSATISAPASVSFTAPTPRPAPADAGTQTAAAPTAGAPQDTAVVSTQTEAPNPFESLGAQPTEVTIDGWNSDGENRSMWHALRNQGYTEAELREDFHGERAIFDSVMEANPDHFPPENRESWDPAQVPSGATLTVPSRENAETVNTDQIEAGESVTVEAGDWRAGAEVEAGRNEDGQQQVTVETQTEDSDARLTTETTLADEGNITTTVQDEGEAVVTESVAQNEDASAISETRTEVTPDETSTTVSDIDGERNSNVTVTNDEVVVTNPGNDGEQDAVTNRIDISESSSDGPLENAGRWVAKQFGFEGDSVEPAQHDNASVVGVTKDENGNRTYYDYDG